MKMNKFLATLLVSAMSMTYSDYKKHCGSKHSNDDDKDDGYLVECNDNSEPNHAEHEGRITWVPKGIFELHCKAADTWQDRVRLEADQLDKNLTLLTGFLSKGPNFDNVSELQWRLMKEQENLMADLLKVLRIRLEFADNEQSGVTDRYFSKLAKLSAVVDDLGASDRAPLDDIVEDITNGERYTTRFACCSDILDAIEDTATDETMSLIKDYFNDVSEEVEHVRRNSVKSNS